MAALTDAQLTVLATTIATNSTAASNSHTLIGAFLNDVVDSKVNLDGYYKSYVALVTQTSTGAPTATVIKNDFSVAIVWSRSSTGIYLATITSTEFTSGLTITMITNSTNGTGTVGAVWVDLNNIQVVSRNFSAAVTDGIITAAAVKIEVYPS